jgi:hypothetical protein
MDQLKKQLTAEDISCARDKTQKKRDRKKQAAVRVKQETASADLEIKSNDGAPDWELAINNKVPSQRWDSQKVPGKTASEIAWQVSEANAGWPWVWVPNQLLTQAPYALNEHNADTNFFHRPQEVQVFKSSIKDRNNMLI